MASGMLHTLLEHGAVASSKSPEPDEELLEQQLGRTRVTNTLSFHRAPPPPPAHLPSIADLEDADNGRRWTNPDLWRRPVRCSPDRTIVIAQGQHSDAHIRNWTSLLFTGCQFEVETNIAERTHSEFTMWAPWIVRNYDRLPRWVVLLSDNGPHWHSPTRFAMLAAQHRPCCRYPLGGQNHDQNNPEAECVKQEQGLSPKGAACKNAEKEREPLAAVSAAFKLNLGVEAGNSRVNLDKMRTGVHLLDAACCNEQILSREAIRSHPRAAYERLAADMARNPGLRWGASMERANAALFSTTCRERMRDDDALWTEVREQCHLVGGCAAGGSTRGVVAPAASCYKPAANVSKYDLANLW